MTTGEPDETGPRPSATGRSQGRDVGTRPLDNPYSRVTLTVVSLLVVVGLGFGVAEWQTAPSTYPPNDPDANAVTLHWVLAAVAVVGTALVVLMARRRRAPVPLSLPLRERARRRVVATLRLRPWTALAPLRALATVVLLYVLLWEPFRAAAQVFAALAPSWTANAWGGPGYWGASLAHWLDGYLLFYAAATLLAVVMVPDRRPVAEPRTV